jgi:hypothetical protein
VTFFHGGPAGLKPGDELRTARELGFVNLQDRGPNQPNYDPDFVYLSKRKNYAQTMAWMQQGAVYEVRPVGPYGRDPDAVDSVKARRAVVVRVVVAAPAPMPQLVAKHQGFVQSQEETV